MKKNRMIVIAAAALLALAVWCAWYARPVTIHDLGPDMKPEIISIMLIRNGGGSDIEHRDLRLVEEDDPDYPPVLEQLEGLRFRRRPTNPLLQAMPFLDTLGSDRVRTIDDYAYHFYIRMRDQGDSDWTVYLTCNFDAWSYLDYDHGVSLPLYVSHAHETAKALGDQLWELAGKAESNL